MSRPVITIAMPVYMAQKTVEEAVRSVLDQTFSDFELLVTDDGSTDDTVMIIQSIHDPRIIYISDGRHLGIAPRLNQMIARAKGEFFARMDADDVMMPYRLEKQLAFLREHLEADVVGSRVIPFSEERREKRETGRVWSEEGSYTRVDSLNHPTIMGRTEWFRNHPYNEVYSGVEDYELWLRVKNEATLLQMNEPLLYYRERLSYDIARCWKERSVGIRMIWKERHLFHSTLRAVCQILNNIMVMTAVPMVHFLHLDKWVILRRNR